MENDSDTAPLLLDAVVTQSLKTNLAAAATESQQQYLRYGAGKN